MEKVNKFKFNKAHIKTLVYGIYGVGYYMCTRPDGQHLIYDIDGGQICLVSNIIKDRKLDEHDIEDAILFVDCKLREIIKDHKFVDEIYDEWQDLLDELNY